jgi:hypothetical protein
MGTKSANLGLKNFMQLVRNFSLQTLEPGSAAVGVQDENGPRLQLACPLIRLDQRERGIRVHHVCVAVPGF